MFINPHGQRKAKCVGDRMRAAEEVKYKLEAKLTLGDVGLLDAAPQAVLFGDYVEPWLPHYVTVACKPSPVRACAKGKHWGCTGRIFSWGRTPTTHRFLHVQRTYDPVHHTFNTPKNGKSRRVDMSQKLRAVLFELRNQRFDAAVLHGTTAIPVVFCEPHSEPLSPTWLYKLHRRVCVLAGLHGNRVHDLRHSYATIQLYEHHAPSNMSQSSWGMPVSRSLWIPTDILAKEPALPWPIGLTP